MATDLATLLSQASGRTHGDNQRSHGCCCGQIRCAYLEKNDVLLQVLETDLQSAAQIGQVRKSFWNGYRRKDNVTDFCLTGTARPS